ncbi:MAG: hypothetical protein COB02_15995 [Candidatus Cloacimonadota bacterium]|nr:MAG: hypothetical protein COB02_15995 [Candidatus Cloacimonadota bacterium]
MDLNFSFALPDHISIYNLFSLVYEKHSEVFLVLLFLHFFLFFFSKKRVSEILALLVNIGLLYLVLSCSRTFSFDLYLCSFVINMYFLTFICSYFLSKKESVNDINTEVIKFILLPGMSTLLLCLFCPLTKLSTTTVYMTPLILFLFIYLTESIFHTKYLIWKSLKYIKEDDLASWQIFNLKQIREEILAPHQIQLKLLPGNSYNAVVYTNQKLIVMDKWLIDKLTPQEFMTVVLHEVGHVLDDKMKSRARRSLFFFMIFIFNLYLISFQPIIATLGIIWSIFCMWGLFYNKIVLETEANADKYVQLFSSYLEFDFLIALEKLRKHSNLDFDYCKKSNMAHLDIDEREALFCGSSINDIILARTMYQVKKNSDKSNKGSYFIARALPYMIVLIFVLFSYGLITNKKEKSTLKALKKEYLNDLKEYKQSTTKETLDRLIKEYKKSDVHCKESRIQVAFTQFYNEYETNYKYQNAKKLTIEALKKCKTWPNSYIHKQLAEMALSRFDLDDAFDLYKSASDLNEKYYRSDFLVLKFIKSNIDEISTDILLVDFLKEDYEYTRVELRYLELFNNVKYHKDKVNDSLKSILKHLKSEEYKYSESFSRYINMFEDNSIESSSLWIKLFASIYSSTHSDEFVNCLLKLKKSSEINKLLQANFTLNLGLQNGDLSNHKINKIRYSLIYLNRKEILKNLDVLQKDSHVLSCSNHQTRSLLWSNWTSWNLKLPLKNSDKLNKNFEANYKKMYQLNMMKKMYMDYSYKK